MVISVIHFICIFLLTLELIFLKSHHRQASLMTAVIKNLKAITELTPSSSEEDAKNTYDSWASSYEAVS